jgi:hypothetical protein
MATMARPTGHNPDKPMTGLRSDRICIVDFQMRNDPRMGNTRNQVRSFVSGSIYETSQGGSSACNHDCVIHADDRRQDRRRSREGEAKSLRQKFRRREQGRAGRNPLPRLHDWALAAVIRARAQPLALRTPGPLPLPRMNSVSQRSRTQRRPAAASIRQMFSPH